jgi:hypothetical protein
VKTSQILHTVVPIFNWQWWQVFLLVLITDWIVIRLIRHLEPAKYKRPQWQSGMYGDLFLPFGVASSVLITQHLANTPVWYTSAVWNWIVAITGLAINFFVRVILNYRVLRKHSRNQLHAPSAYWHSLIFVLVFYIIGMTAVPAVLLHKPTGIFLLAVVGYAGWAITFLYDVAHPSGFMRQN